MTDVTNHNHGKDHIAYFTMEIGISHHIPTYAGGLGILAGDLLKSFADIKLPVVGMTLLNEKGYFYQRIDDNGWQHEDPVEWNVHDYLTPLPNTVTVTIEGREVKVKAWKHIIEGNAGSGVPIIFLDTNTEGNSEYDKAITARLYAGDKRYRLAQEIVLGVGGTRMLESLGYAIKKYHMNEGHSALLTIELLRKTAINKDTLDFDSVKNKCVFTTHTPVTAGHDRFDMSLFKGMVGNYVPESILSKVTQDGMVNMTLIALQHSKYVNGVAKRHGEVTREMFPEYRIDSITNGVHPFTWTCTSFKTLFDEYIPGWSIDPYTLRYALSIPKDKILLAHEEAKRAMIDEINFRTNAKFHPDRFTIGYARRFTAYKRPDILVTDLNRLVEISKKVGDIQIIYAGKAHAQDTQGKELIQKIITLSKEINAKEEHIKIIFLDNYDMSLAKMLVSGCDVWLNTPQRPYEASGTSGMKAAMNGIPQVSTLDGWWIEGHIENTTGWSLGAHPQDPDFKNDPDGLDEAKDLYHKLETKIIPTYYSSKDEWAGIMRHVIAMNASFFNTYRMAQQYIVNAYQD